MKSKKELIFEAVINHIKTKGLLRGLTISEIARKADVGKGTVYEYFTSKDELIAETLIYILDESSRIILENENTKLEFRETLCSHIQVVMDISQEYTNLDMLIMTEDLGGLLQSNIKQKMMDKIIGIKNKYHSFLNSIFHKGINEGIIRQIEDPYITFIIGNLIMSSVTYYFHEEHNEKSDIEFINKVYNLIIKLLQ